jgi:hypothetical protein
VERPLVRKCDWWIRGVSDEGDMLCVKAVSVMRVFPQTLESNMLPIFSWFERDFNNEIDL